MREEKKIPLILPKFSFVVHNVIHNFFVKEEGLGVAIY